MNIPEARQTLEQLEAKQLECFNFTHGYTAGSPLIKVEIDLTCLEGNETEVNDAIKALKTLQWKKKVDTKDEQVWVKPGSEEDREEKASE